MNFDDPDDHLNIEKGYSFLSFNKTVTTGFNEEMPRPGE